MPNMEMDYIIFSGFALISLKFSNECRCNVAVCINNTSFIIQLLDLKYRNKNKSCFTTVKTTFTCT